jgi:hypothetical protein
MKIPIDKLRVGSRWIHYRNHVFTRPIGEFLGTVLDAGEYVPRFNFVAEKGE